MNKHNHHTPSNTHKHTHHYSSSNSSSNPNMSQQPEHLYADEESSFFKEITDESLAHALFRGSLVRPSLLPAAKDNELWKSSVDKVIAKFRAYNLEVSSPLSAPWKASNLGNASIPQQAYRQNNIIKFHCQRCKSLSQTFSLIGVGQCVKDNDGSASLKMLRVFYHDNDCHDVVRKPPPDYCVIPYDYDEVIGDTYDSVVTRFKSFKFPDLPPGKHIDFGHDDYNFDNRAYEYLPSDLYPEVDKDIHRSAMLRFFYYLVGYLNMAEEAAHMVIDTKTLTDKYKHRSGRTHPSIQNAEAHLFLNEIGLLFGGHSMMKEGEIDEPVHQICHKDGETHGGEIASVEQLKGKHKPGSYILPLDDYRQIYVCTPELKVTAQKGEFIWFHGALPHGGLSYRPSLQGNDWHPAIHGHLDSIHHARKRGDFSQGPMIERIQFRSRPLGSCVLFHSLLDHRPFSSHF
jgi:hypothetical protein